MYLEVLHPYDGLAVNNPNDYSIIIKLVYKDSSLIIMGDASKKVEQDLLNIYGERLHPEILRLGHHGSKTSTSDLFLKTLNPQYAIISVGCNNSFGHPHKTVLETLKKNKLKGLSTCEYGDIVFEFKDNHWLLQGI